MSTKIKFVGSVIQHDEACAWCWKNIGTQGIIWSWHYWRRSGDHYYVFAFEKPEDAVMFSLRFA